MGGKKNIGDRESLVPPDKGGNRRKPEGGNIPQKIREVAFPNVSLS